MLMVHERAAPPARGTASTTTRYESTTAAARGASFARRFGPNVGHLILIALAAAGGLAR